MSDRNSDYSAKGFDFTSITLRPAHLRVVRGLQLADALPQRTALRLVLGDLGQRRRVLRVDGLLRRQLLLDGACRRLLLQLALRAGV